MSIYLVKRALPFVLTLIFGTGLGSIFGGSSSPRTAEVAPTFAPARSYKACPSRRRNFESTTPSQSGESSANPTRSDSTLISR